MFNPKIQVIQLFGAALILLTNFHLALKKYYKEINKYKK